MLILEAIAAADGWAIVRSDLGLQIVRPPYVGPVGSQLIDGESGLARAVLAEGFTAIHREFDTWATLIAWLRSARTAATGEVSDAEADAAARSILARAGLERLEGFVNRAEAYLGEGETAGAKRLLVVLHDLPLVQRTSDLESRVTRLLAECAVRDTRLRAQRPTAPVLWRRTGSPATNLSTPAEMWEAA